MVMEASISASDIDGPRGTRELVDLTIAIGLINTWNRMAISFRSTPQAAL